MWKIEIAQCRKMNMSQGQPERDLNPKPLAPKSPLWQLLVRDAIAVCTRRPKIWGSISFRMTLWQTALKIIVHNLWDSPKQSYTYARLTLKWNAQKHYQMPLRQQGIWLGYIESCIRKMCLMSNLYSVLQHLHTDQSEKTIKGDILHYRLIEYIYSIPIRWDVCESII